MIEKIKYHLSRAMLSKQMRVSCLAVMTAVTVAVVTLLSYSIYTVNIFDGEKTYTIRTLNNSITSALSGVELKSDSYNIENTIVTGRTTSIEIAYTYPVYITSNNNTVEIETSDCTVEEALNEAGFTVDEFDFVEPSADTMITGTVYIDYTDINYVDGSYEEKIPYKTDTVYSDELPKGKTKVNAGSEGVQLVSYTEKFVNGVSQGKTVTDTEIKVEAVNAKRIVGTKVVKTSSTVKSISVLSPSKEIELDENGNPIKYKSKTTVRATAYTYTGNRCATGVSPKPGYIAVNPKVIPYGTKLYIKSADGSVVYGYAIAADTGGFIRKHPTGVDLFMASESACRSFGVRNMEIYVLE